jgi:HD-GYP domain-containing protein (c-di-GMP phosphodiesterase class II)
MADLLVAHVAYQHHEHQDGSGYPRGLKGPNRLLTRAEALKAPSTLIHRYANIVAVANVYDHLAGVPPNGSALPVGETARRLNQVAETQLNRAVVDALRSLVPPYPVASDVWVTDGQYRGFQGVVVQVPKRQQDRPIVRLVSNREGKRIRPVEIDTSDGPVGVSAEPPEASA